MNFDLFDTPRPEISPLEAEETLRETYGISATAVLLPGERDRTFRVDIPGSVGHILKFANKADRPDALAAQGAAIEHALAMDPSLPLPRTITTNDGTTTGRYRDHEVMLTDFLVGVAPPPTGSSPSLKRAVGKMSARLSRALRGHDNPILHRPFPWDLTRLSELEPLLEYLDSEKRGVVADALNRYIAEIEPQLAHLPAQAIHGDLHDDNLVLSADDPEEICGVFDFGDMTWAPRLCDLAVAATYQTFGGDPAVGISQTAAAFHVVDPLDLNEIELLPGLVAGRCIQSLLMAARHLATHPENAEYASGDALQMFETLLAVESADRAATVDKIRSSCGFRIDEKIPLNEARSRRRNTMGPALDLSYSEPVRPIRGDGVWLYDRDGRRYLDAYNNVPHVGHSHPQVVSAISAQTRRLSTNTRYLVDSVTEYAERLARLFPDPLSVVMFTNSGSEANDLAYQIAVAATGHYGVVTTENAYHGTTWATAAMSPEEFGGFSDRTGRVRGHEILENDKAGLLLTADLDGAVSRMASNGSSPAAAIFDTVFSSEGIHELPDGYLESARAWVDRQGALLIADEVQAGFGRVGPKFWGFKHSSVVPDIVTLGKPMGNGYPIGAVVTTSAIAERFADRWHYFSTFAGSPVATAAGMAVLDVIEDEMLVEQAQLTGDYLRSGIASLAHPSVTHVRGPGLFIGVEMTSPDRAGRVKEEMKDHGVLIGTTGPDESVLKIRPPMVFGRIHADILLERLGRVLGRVANSGGGR
ncbi:MAG TPA: aminotransferase class III-fold pyridoxal phosphate-dependent enzyme [Acidimicrobiia bacterium]